MIFYKKIILGITVIFCSEFSLQAMFKSTTTKSVTFIQPVNNIGSWSRALASKTLYGTSSGTSAVTVNDTAVNSTQSQNRADFFIPWYQRYAQKGIPQEDIATLSDNALYFTKLLAHQRHLSQEVARLRERYNQAQTAEEKARIASSIKQVLLEVQDTKNLMYKHDQELERKQRAAVHSEIYQDYNHMHNRYAWESALMNRLEKEVEMLRAQDQSAEHQHSVNFEKK